MQVKKITEEMRRATGSSSYLHVLISLLERVKQFIATCGVREMKVKVDICMYANINFSIINILYGLAALSMHVQVLIMSLDGSSGFSVDQLKGTTFADAGPKL